MAARGYWQAFQAVQKSLGKILKGGNPGEVADEDHGTWYREIFAPSVTVGLLKPADLAGYRNGQVNIRKSGERTDEDRWTEAYFFVPFTSCPPWWSIRCVTSPFSLLKNSTSASTTFRKNFVSDSANSGNLPCPVACVIN
jgi:hypothetical protein